MAIVGTYLIAVASANVWMMPHFALGGCVGARGLYYVSLGCRIPGRNFLKDEIVIRNSDSGKGM